MMVAEYGLQEQLALLTGLDVNDIDPATVGTLVQNRTVPNGSRPAGRYSLRALPLGWDGSYYMLESEGLVDAGNQQAVRRASMLVRTAGFQVPFEGAITAIGTFTRAGAARVRGEDACDLTNPAKPGVTALHEDSVQGLLHGQVEAITGSPPVREYPALTTDTLSQFGGYDLDELIALATLHYSGTASNPANPKNMQPATATGPDGELVCNRFPGGPRDNWGEPLPSTDSEHVAVCANYAPIIHSAGPMLLETGRGQGILIVEGHLVVKGNFQFDGVVVVTGNFTMEGTGQGEPKINGTVIVHGVGELDPDGDHATTGNARVQWDSCAVNKVGLALPLRPFAGRAWVSDAPPLP
jgi:hypothetical protein